MICSSFPSYEEYLLLDIALCLVVTLLTFFFYCFFTLSSCFLPLILLPLSGSPDKANKEDVLKKTLQVSNLSPLLTVEQLKQLFGFCGTVVECTITDSKHFAYIEYSKPEEAAAAMALNNIDVGGRPLNVEMAKSLPPKPTMNSSLTSSSLPLMMQQAVAMQQMQFQQALIMQQNMTAQQAANRAATMKSATDLAAARALEISKKLNPDGLEIEEKETKQKSRCDILLVVLMIMYAPSASK